MKICHCGYTATDHHFRHAFAETATVIDNTDLVSEWFKENSGPFTHVVFVVEGELFPLLTKKSKCGKEQCGKAKDVHKTGLSDDEIIDPPDKVKTGIKSKALVHHMYEESSPIQYRHVKFLLPKSAVCIVCGNAWNDHKPNKDNQIVYSNSTTSRTFENHIFTTRVEVKGKTVNDELTIIDPDDDDNKITNLNCK